MNQAFAEEGSSVGPRLSPAGGVAIAGADLSRPLSVVLRRRIRAALLAHHVVVFPGQALSREAQFAFAATLGEVEEPEPHKAQGKRRGVAHVISNLDAAGHPVDRSRSAVSNYRWHTDKSYHATPPALTTLYAVEVPATGGGDTEFANTAMGYAALPAATKRRIEAFRVVFRWGVGLGEGAASADAPGAAAAVDHPLVRTHPETGVRALYLGNHASHIKGLPVAAGAALLAELLAHTTLPRFVYVHRWRQGDLVMWDNRCLLHRAVANFDLEKERRILHRAVVRGTIPF
jgi:alpha-ketoglutarate-dependent taurine dioxygenase